MRIEKITSTSDPRITHLRRIGGGEGFATYSGQFEGKPAFIVDSATMADLLDEADRFDDNVSVRIFDSNGERDRYIDALPSESLGEVGLPWNETSPPSELSVDARVRGCLLGGAVGDALGASIEFMSLGNIRSAFGPDGLQELAPAYGRIGAITDDTQMTLFTVEGLLRAHVRAEDRGICHPPGVIHHALLRWLLTQGETSPAFPRNNDEWPDGWLVNQKQLHARRAPGNTCLSALRASKRFGDEAQNDSKGCGSIMRIAPIGLFVKTDDVPSEGSAPLAFTMACESAKSTHGHVSSTLSSGFFSLVIARLRTGLSLTEAIATSKTWVAQERASHEVMAAIEGAVSLAASQADSTPESVERLGAGWVAEEALAISLFCALRAETFEHGVRLAVNHGGDSDSTGSLTGQLLGARWGVECIPQRWLDKLELREVIDEVARDLLSVEKGRPWEELRARYPGW